jgi:hypothetical protein
MASQIVIEHGESRFGRRLRTTRYKVVLAIAALEGILVVVGAIPWWLVFALAVVAVGGYLAWGREHESPDVRVVTWTAAVSQLLVVLVPVFAAALLALAVLVVIALAVLVLAALLLDRR